MALNISSKRVQIDKANLNILIAVSVAVFITVFSLISVKALLSQRSYQSRVISKKEVANNTLDDNLKAVAQLSTAYQVFVSPAENVIGGNSSGTGERDGNNAKIVLDALPSKYDFPALASSLEKIVTDNKFKINGITGIDDELNQSVDTKGAPGQLVDMPFQLDVSAPYTSIGSFFTILEHSIRPFQVHEITFSGTDSALSISVTAKTYYQPSKSLQIKKETAK